MRNLLRLCVPKFYEKDVAVERKVDVGDSRCEAVLGQKQHDHIEQPRFRRFKFASSMKSDRQYKPVVPDTTQTHFESIVRYRVEHQVMP